MRAWHVYLEAFIILWVILWVTKLGIIQSWRITKFFAKIAAGLSIAGMIVYVLLTEWRDARKS